MTTVQRRAPRHTPADACCYPDCDRARSTVIPHPLCPQHAQAVYLDVADLVDATSPELRSAVLGTTGRARPYQQPTPQAHAGVVYYMRFGDLIKIGFTTNLPVRQRTLRPDEVLATEPGTMDLERARHMQFGHAYVRREMFRCTPDLREHVERLAAG